MIITTNHRSVESPSGNPPRSLFIMDFDGTLLRSDRTFSPIDLDALVRLGELGIIRVIATGRSLYSFKTVVPKNLPIDYIIFSTGAGVQHRASENVIRRVRLEPHEVRRACAILKARQLDFMIHRTIPDNHMFTYFRSNHTNLDFERRLKLYDRFAAPLDDTEGGCGPATQLLAIIPPENGPVTFESIRREMSGFSVIRTTSPLDGLATWVEIFPRAVSKSRTAAWLAEQLGIDNRQTASVGNDYNDLDLLEWAPHSYVVDNAPADLKQRFAAVASNNDGGVAEAVARWQTEKMRSED